MRHTQDTAIVMSVTQKKYITTTLGTFFCVTDVRQNIVIGHFTVKWPQEKWACDFNDDAMFLSFQLQVAEDFF